MNYLDNYLSIIPEYDRLQIEKALKENEKHFGLESISDVAFKGLVKQLSESDDIITNTPNLSEKIESDELNSFYSSLAIDLKRLFNKQESIEVANENYYHIYQANLEEIARGVDSLSRHINQLKYTKNKEKGLVLKEYSFEKENETHFTENYNQDTSYLFIDRDGSQLEPAQINRFYHNYSLTLQKKEEVNALRNEENITTANVEILYETPGTLQNTNPAYAPNKAIDNSTETFWYNVCLKTNNSLDKISINPKGWG